MFFMKKSFYLYLLVCLIIISACSTTPAPAATPSPQPTETPTPITIANFTAKLEGVGEHGNMACITYQGNKTDVEGMTITADIYQDGRVLDSKIPLESMTGKDCFELLDAKYSSGISTILQVNIQSPVSTNVQTIPLGEYSLSPFMGWYFGSSNISRIVNMPNPRHENAYDIAGTSKEYPSGKNHPVYSPCDGVALNKGIVRLDPWFHNFWLYCEDTGFLIHLGHMESSLATSHGVPVEFGQLLGNLFPDPGIDYYYHTHTKIIKPNLLPYNSKDLEDGLVVDIFNPQMQLGGEALDYGFWLPYTLPDQVKNLIEKGKFIPKYDTPRYFIYIY